MQEEVLIVGGGPAGYAAALGLSREGFGARIVERAEVGGTCLHRGCIPTKALLESARVAAAVAAAGSFGITAAGPPVADWPAIRARQRQAVDALATGLRTLIRQAGIAVEPGWARMLPPAEDGGPRVRVERPAGDVAQYAPRAVVLAPGARAVRPPIAGLDLPGVLDSDGLLALAEGPRRLCVVGGGAIGCEFATAYADLGGEVTIVEAQAQLLPAADAEIARRLAAALRRRGIGVILGAAVAEILPGPVVRVRTADGERDLAADAVLVAVGRSPATRGLGLEEAGVGRDGGPIAVGPDMRTRAARVWAAGDAIGGAMVAHGAFAQAATIVAAIAGKPVLPLPPIPQPVFCRPEVAWVGVTEAAAAASGPVRVARVPYAALGRAHTAGAVDGLCKLVAGADGRLLGAHLVGEHATESIASACVALAAGASIEDLERAVFPHPTFSEGLHEAAALLAGRPLHLPLTR